MKWTRIIPVVLLALVILVASACRGGSGGGSGGSYFPPYAEKSFTVENLSSRTLTAHLDAGERLEGYFTIRGGQDEVKFWIEDPHGATIYNAGLVYDYHNFNVIVSRTGYYTMYWDNSFSWTVDKHVYLKYRYY